MKSNKPNNISYNKNKRPFLLIEILVAFVIISLLSVPLIRNPIYFFTHQIQSLEKLECERIADLTFLEIKLESYKDKNSFDINAIGRTIKQAKEIYLEDYLLDTFNQKPIKRWYKLTSTKKMKENFEGKFYKFLNVQVSLQPQGIEKKNAYKYKYQMICKKN